MDANTDLLPITSIAVRETSCPSHIITLNISNCLTQLRTSHVVASNKAQHLLSQTDFNNILKDVVLPPPRPEASSGSQHGRPDSTRSDNNLLLCKMLTLNTLSGIFLILSKLIERTFEQQFLHVNQFVITNLKWIQTGKKPTETNVISPHTLSICQHPQCSL